MTDNEIVKALECCIAKPIALCKNCPYFLGNGKCKHSKMQREALDLINRQQAEIEALKKVVVDDYATEYDEKIKAEAVKDFVDRLLEKAISTRNYFEIKSLVTTVAKEVAGDTK